MKRTQTALAMLVALVMAGCGSNTNGDVAVAIKDEADFRAKIATARDLSLEPLKAHQAGTPLSDLDLKNLAEARRIFNGLIAFDPASMNLYLGAAKVDLALGDETGAIDRLADVARREWTLRDDADRQTLAECLGELGRLQLKAKKLSDAEGTLQSALKLFPNNVDYTAELAGIKIEQRQYADARKLLDSNLKLAPNHPRSQQLRKLLDLSAGSQ